MDAHIALRTLFALFALWFAVYYLWRDFRHDAFREDIFMVRDNMFLYAAEGNIPFDHPAYTMLRDRMNGLLRHAHELTLTRMVFVLLTHRGADATAMPRWEAALADLPPETQACMREFNLCFGISVLQHVVLNSFFRYLLLRPVAMMIQLRVLMKSPKVATSVQQLECETLEQDRRRLISSAAAA